MKVTISYFKREDVFDVSLENPKRKFGSDDYDDKTEKQTISFAIKDGDAIVGLKCLWCLFFFQIFHKWPVILTRFFFCLCQIGIWNYAVKVNKHDDQPITVTVSAKPRRDFPIILRSWTNMGSRGVK